MTSSASTMWSMQPSDATTRRAPAASAGPAPASTISARMARGSSPAPRLGRRRRAPAASDCWIGGASAIVRAGPHRASDHGPPRRPAAGGTRPRRGRDAELLGLGQLGAGDSRPPPGSRSSSTPSPPACRRRRGSPPRPPGGRSPRACRSRRASCRPAARSAAAPGGGTTGRSGTTPDIDELAQDAPAVASSANQRPSAAATVGPMPVDLGSASGSSVASRRSSASTRREPRIGHDRRRSGGG